LHRSCLRAPMHKILSIRVSTRQLPLSRARVLHMRNLDQYDWILFTSTHAVEYFVQALAEHNIVFPKKVSVAAVGPATRRALRAHGLRARLIPEEATALHLAKALGAVRNKRILFPRSTLASRNAVEYLRVHGAEVRVIRLYTTLPPVVTTAERDNLTTYTGISFTSASGVNGFVKQLTTKERAYARMLPAYCIGPTTLKAARAAGFKKAIVRGML
jgi:uroporphyrinogen III methyltransferase / synthase